MKFDTTNEHYGICDKRELPIFKDLDVESLSYIAGQGNVKAQVELGKRYYFGTADEHQGVIIGSFYESQKWFAKAAEQGDPEAKLYLAKIYTYGDEEVKQDLHKAYRLCLDAASQGYLEAQFTLAYKYLKGEGVKQDFVNAYDWFRRASRQGHQLAQEAVRAMHNEGNFDFEDISVVTRQKGGEKFLRELNNIISNAIECWKGTAQQDEDSGDKFEAKYNLARMHYYGLGVPQDIKYAHELFEEAAKNGNGPASAEIYMHFFVPNLAKGGSIRAQVELGKMYYFGNGVPQDFVLAFEYFSKAAEKCKWITQGTPLGNAIPLYYLGKMYLNGEGTEKNIEQAIKWLTLASINGYSDAQCDLGHLYLNGQDGVEKDYQEAHKWLTKAAEQEDPDAACTLADNYFMGVNDEQDFVKAYELYSIAADGNNKHAQEMLVMMHKIGKAAPVVMSNAIESWKKVAEQEESSKGKYEAQFNLARMFFYGLGVEKDLAEASRLLQEAFKKGRHKEAREFFNNNFNK